MADPMGQYQAIFDRVGSKTEKLRSYLGMIRSHLHLVEDRMVSLNLGIDVSVENIEENWRATYDIQFSNWDEESYSRRGPGSIRVSYHEREIPNHRGNRFSRCYSIDSLCHELLLAAYRHLPELIEAYITKAVTLNEKTGQLESMIHEFRDSATPLIGKL